MKRIQYYMTMLTLTAGLLMSCDRNGVDDIRFSVKVQNNATTVRAGEPVTFLFEGNAEYIAFFSGESGNNYANIDRDSVGISALGMGCTIKQQYTDTEYRGQEIIQAYISTDFNGKYTLDDIRKADWRKITGQGDNLLPVPLTESSPTDQTSGAIDLMDYRNRAFYVAFRYHAPRRTDVPASSGGGRYVVAPRIDVNPLTLQKTTAEGESVLWDNPSTEWAFRVVYESSTQTSNYSANDGGLLFQPQQNQEHTDDDVTVWMVSRLIRPWEVEPDRGTAIKSSDAYLTSYTHTYANPGEYQVTFIATNANLWNSDRMVKQLTLTVSE